jgi:fluoroquinolone transport system permease protein
MKRLLSTIRCDIRLQFRNGFYYVVGFILAGCALLLTQIPAIDWGRLLPALVLSNLIVATFYFVGGLVQLEKGEGTLEAQVVTPLTPWEYLASKVISLTGLSLVENLIIVGLAYGLGFWVFPMVLGIGLASAIFVLVGFMAIARYDSINEYLFPSVLYTMALVLPLLHYFGIWENWLFYLHPLQAPLILMKAAFLPVEIWQLAYGLLYSVLWIAILFLCSRRSFHNFIVIKAGVR